MSEINFNKQFEQGKSIDDVQISLRLDQLLRSQNLINLSDIVAKGEAYFVHENMPGFTPKDLRELKTILAENNIDFS